MKTAVGSDSSPSIKRWIAIGNGCCSVLAAAVLAIGSSANDQEAAEAIGPTVIVISNGVPAPEGFAVSEPDLDAMTIKANGERRKPAALLRNQAMCEPDHGEFDLVTGEGMVVAPCPSSSSSLVIGVDTLLLGVETYCPDAPPVALGMPDSVKDKL